MDAVLAKRLKAFERVVLKALPDESLGRLLSSGGITAKEALEDFGCCHLQVPESKAALRYHTSGQSPKKHHG
eukprot:5988206-Amphidinium_carterae.1